MANGEANDPNDKTRYSLTFSLEEGGYFRRTCPSCGRDFKNKVSPGDLASIMQPTFQQLDIDLGELTNFETEDGEKAQEEHKLFCPYCGHHDDSSNMLTQALVDYLKRYAMREIVLPQVNKMFSELEDSFGGNRRSSGGMFSLEVRIEHTPFILPPRPISGPEPPDMQAVEFLCCGERGKVLDGWFDVITCPFCGTEGVLH